jgi:hypothetical protein
MLGMTLFIPVCRPRLPYLSPYNWALALFFLELVILPANMMTAGIRRGVLPSRPSAPSIEYAYLLTVLAYVSFAAAYAVTARRPRRRLRRVRTWWVMSKSLGVGYIGLGVLGFGLIFSAASLLAYYANPMNRVADSRSAATLASAASTFLRPFLAFGAVGLWCRSVDAKRLARVPLLLSGMFCGFVMSVTFLSYGYNRATVAAPLICLAATIGKYIKTLPLWFIAFAGALLLTLLLFVGQYRDTRVGLTDVVGDRELAASLTSHVDVADSLQINSSAPQFTAYLLDATEWGNHPSFGQSLFATLMFTIPILGKPWRASSGVALYNTLIYGNSRTIDQPVPFVAELFMNFHVLGVICGYALLGYFIRHLQEHFEGSGGALHAFSVQYVTIWLCYTIHSSCLVVTQMLVYFCPPIYVLIFLGYFRRPSREGQRVARVPERLPRPTFQATGE